jgi:hypothetical protein
MKKLGLGAALVGALAFALPTATALADQSHDCGMGRSITLTGANTLWPPNHKYHDYTVTAIGNAMDFHTDLMTAITSNEPDIGIGSGGPQHANDANPAMASDSEDSNTASTFHQLRAERAGPGNGRTYTFNVTATWDMLMTTTCMAQFTVNVPHDQGS